MGENAMNRKSLGWKGYLGMGMILIAVGLVPENDTPFWLYLLIAFICLVVGAVLVAEDTA
jgi:hypothetical membrane protein